MRFLVGLLSLSVLAAVVVLIFGNPELGLKVLWSAIVPLAPIIFYFAMNLWVSLCPFAFLQSLPGSLGRSGTRRVSDNTARILSHIAWLLLFLLVPLRHFLFDTSGAFAVAAILGIGAASLLSGLLFQGLSGWCNSLCPVKPVEYIYGQFSIYSRLPTHCHPCSACTDQCGRIRKPNLEKHLTKLSYAFPGFVFAFFHTSREQHWASVYFAHLVAMGLSFLLFLFARRFVSHATVLKLAGAFAITLYYYFMIPRIGSAFGWNADTVDALTTLILAVILIRATIVILELRHEST